MSLSPDDLRYLGEAATRHNFMRPEYGKFSSWDQFCRIQYDMSVIMINKLMRSAGYIPHSDHVQLNNLRPVKATLIKNRKSRVVPTVLETARLFDIHPYHLIRLLDDLPAPPHRQILFAWEPCSSYDAICAAYHTGQVRSLKQYLMQQLLTK